MRLFDRHPRPWRICEDVSVTGTFTVLNNNNETVIFSGTYSGDGNEEFNLDGPQVAELVALVNAAPERW
jgi:hypothetical protein